MATGPSEHGGTDFLPSRSGDFRARHAGRIPADSSFQKALEHLGFHTAWVGAQSEDVAWPDARERHFGTQSDREVLLPALDHVLAAGHTRLSLVLHMVGAHEPYCSRFDRRTAPFDATACDRLGDTPDETTLPATLEGAVRSGWAAGSLS